METERKKHINMLVLLLKLDMPSLFQRIRNTLKKDRNNDDTLQLLQIKLESLHKIKTKLMRVLMIQTEAVIEYFQVGEVS